MDIKLEKGRAVSGTVTAITSKSYVHRLLLAAALCKDKVSISSNILSKDMEATIRVINTLGGSISVEQIPRDSGEKKGYLFTVQRSLFEGAKLCRDQGSSDPLVLDCGESIRWFSTAERADLRQGLFFR